MGDYPVKDGDGNVLVAGANTSRYDKNSIQLLTDATVIATGDSFKTSGDVERTFQGKVTGTGALTATISIDVSNDNSTWIPDFLVITLVGDDSVTDGGTSNAAWSFVRARLTAITGTDAKANAYMGA